jgi:hypothetical protein
MSRRASGLPRSAMLSPRLLRRWFDLKPDRSIRVKQF